MASAHHNRLRFLESRVADTSAIAHDTFAGPQESPHGTYFLTSTEQEAMRKQTRMKMRRTRLVQVRAQEMLLASRRLEQVRERRRKAKESLLREVKMEWEAGQRHRLDQLEKECAAALDGVGQAHRAATKLQRLKEVKQIADALQAEERRCFAVFRYTEALEKEYERREELESKKGLALERRKQVADTAEMDRNLARVSAYGAKIRSTLRQIKQTIQPECKPDYEVTKLRDYKYTFMHSHWAALRDKTNTKEDDTNAWEAADRKRVEHDQMRSRDGEEARIAKQRVAQRGKAAQHQFAKKQEIRRLENELRTAERQEKEHKVAVMLSGEPYHTEALSTGVQQVHASEKVIGFARGVMDEEQFQDREAPVEMHSADTSENRVKPLPPNERSPLQIQVEASAESPAHGVTVHAPECVIVNHQRKELTAKSGVTGGFGLHPPSKLVVCEHSQAHVSKPSVRKSVDLSETVRSEENGSLGTCPRLKARYRHNAPSVSCRPRSVGAKEKTGEVVKQSRRNWREDCEEPLKGGKVRVAQVSSSAQGNKKRATKLECRSCPRSGQGDEDKNVRIRKNIRFRNCSFVPGHSNPIAPAAACEHGGAIASAVSLLDQICETAEVLEKLQELNTEKLARRKLPSSMKHQIRSTQEQLKALEQELYGQPEDLQGFHQISKNQANTKIKRLTEAAQKRLHERRTAGLEKHMRRMHNRIAIHQVGKNLWNIEEGRERSVKKRLPEMRESEKPIRHVIKTVRLKTEVGNASVTESSKGNQVQGAIQSRRQQGIKKSVLSMHLEDLKFLKELQQSLQVLNNTSVVDGLDKVPQSYKAIVKGDRRTGGHEKTSRLFRKIRKRRKQLPCTDGRQKAGGAFEELALPDESGVSIGPWDIEGDALKVNGANVWKTKRSGDWRARQVSAREKKSQKPQSRHSGNNQSNGVFENEQNPESQDSCNAKAAGSPKTEHPWQRHLVNDSQIQPPLEAKVLSQTSSAEKDVTEQDDATEVDDMSFLNMMTTMESVDAEALKWDVQELDHLLRKHTGGTAAGSNQSDDRPRLQSVAIQVTGTDLDSYTCEEGGGANELGSLSEAEEANDIMKQAPIRTTHGYVLPADAHGKSGAGSTSWEKIWEEVCGSIDSELECFGFRADSSSLNTLQGEYRNWQLWELHSQTVGNGRGLLSKNPAPDRVITCHSEVSGGDTLRSSADVATETDQPSLDSILGSLSQQVRELDDRLRSATCSAVASSWAISENSRRSRRTPSLDRLNLHSTDETAGCPQVDRWPSTEGTSSLLSLPTGTPWSRTVNSLPEEETSNLNIDTDDRVVPGIQMRRATVCLEGKGDVDCASSETGSPVSPLGLCFDALHDRHSTVDTGVDRHALETVHAVQNHGVPRAACTFPLYCHAPANGGHTSGTGKGKYWAQHDVGADYEAPCALVLPCRPRIATANRQCAKEKMTTGTREPSELSTEAQYQGQSVTQASCFLLAANELGADSQRRAREHSLVNNSLSSLDLLDIGESLLTESVDFSLWSSEIIRDVFDHPETPR